MNERIRDIAEHCDFYVGNEHYDKSHEEKQRLFMEKFAELIVRECVDKITTYDLVPGHSAKWEDIYDIHARLLQDLGEELKEHFGVTK